MLLLRVPAELTRIISDLHFGDRASRVHRLDQLAPLLAGVSHLVLNGDTLDTRPSADPLHAEQCRAAVAGFFPRHVGRVTFVTGNHDADFSPHHHLDLAGGAVFATHGDILFDDLVPWSQDARAAGRHIKEELHRLPPGRRLELDPRLAVFRRVAMAIPQRHQSEKNRLRYALQYLADTVWPPHRVFLVIHAWRVMPARAATLLRRHRPQARFIVTGHTHRAGLWHMPDGIVVINTGSFTLPIGACAVDLTAGTLTVRRIDLRADRFAPGAIIAAFPLAAS
jgi:predicted phosphodiesterase